MVSMRTAATGRRRYGMGNSFAPNRGQVDPSGYIKREIKNRNMGRWAQPVQGADRFSAFKAPSQRRSGIAAGALAERGKGVAKRNNNKSFAPNRWPKAINNKPQANKGGGIRGSGPWPKLPKGGKGTPGATPPVNPGGTPAPAGPASVAAPTIPTVRINANGRLDLPFDQAFSLGLLEQQQAADAELLSLQGDEQQWDLDLQKARRELNQNYDDAKRGTLNNYASAGTAYSSGYGNAVSENATEYNNFVNDLSAEDTLARTQFGNARIGIQNAMQDFIRQAVLRQAEELARTQAGDLGYGVTTGPKPAQSRPKKPSSQSPKKPAAKKAAPKPPPAKKAPNPPKKRGK